MCERERESARAREREIKRDLRLFRIEEREREQVCVCERERERVRVRERERERDLRLFRIEEPVKTYPPLRHRARLLAVIDKMVYM